MSVYQEDLLSVRRARVQETERYMESRAELQLTAVAAGIKAEYSRKRRRSEDEEEEEEDGPDEQEDETEQLKVGHRMVTAGGDSGEGGGRLCLVREGRRGGGQKHCGKSDLTAIVARSG